MATHTNQSTTPEPLHYINQRISYGNALCTVRWIGTLPKTSGTWLGVEWDDVSRGKHDGTFNGRRIFRCLARYDQTAASFVRPSRKPDNVRTMIEGIRRKYANAGDGSHTDGPHGTSAGLRGDDLAATNLEERKQIIVSGKVVEEVGFDKIAAQLSQLAELRIVLLDELQLCGVLKRSDEWTDDLVQAAQDELRRACPKIIDLDVGWNLMESWEAVLEMCVPFEQLRTLKASGLRMWDVQSHSTGQRRQFETVQELQLNECLLSADQVVKLLSYDGQEAPVFPVLKTLSLNSNELTVFSTIATKSFSTITTLSLDSNFFTDLSILPTIFALFPNLSILSLQGNSISDLNLSTTTPTTPIFASLTTLNIAANKITTYAFIHSLPTIFPNLTSLRISRNPLYESVAEPAQPAEKTSTLPQHGPLSSGAQADSRSYYLTLARIPKLKSLNYTTITPRDREEGEIYYLSVVDREVTTILESHDRRPQPELILKQLDAINGRNPLYSSLCTKYDRDNLIARYSKLYSPSESTSGSQTSPDINSTSTTTDHSKHLERYKPGTLGSRLVNAYFYLSPPFTACPQAPSQLPSNPTNPPPQSHHQPLPTTISVYRLKSIVARVFKLQPLRFRLIYESDEYDPVERISRNTGASGAVTAASTIAPAAANTANTESRSTTETRAGVESSNNITHDDDAQVAEWRRWGDWDVDDLDEDDDDVEETQTTAINVLPSAGPDDDSRSSNRDKHDNGNGMYIVRAGQRFKKRETEILDGLRPWGDFLDEVVVPGGAGGVGIGVGFGREIGSPSSLVGGGKSSRSDAMMDGARLDDAGNQVGGHGGGKYIRPVSIRVEPF